jgi:hypothetical protein
MKVIPKMRVEMYTPYLEQFEKVLKNLDIKIHECLNYAAKPFKEIVSSNSPVPQEYPDASTFDYKVFLGLQGDYCTLQHLPVTIGNYEPIQGVQYCGFGLQKDDGVEKKMIPWMSGKLLRSYSETEIAHADTPEKLYQQAAQYVKLPAGALCNNDARIDGTNECKMAGKYFGGCLGENESGDPSIVIGEWHNAPRGCFIKSIDTSVIYLNKHKGQGGKGEYSSLCRREKGGVYDRYTYTVVGTTNACPTGAALTKDECRQAGKELGGILPGSKPIEEYNNDAPTGCYHNLNPGPDKNVIFYNLNKFGRGQHGLTSICRKVPFTSGNFTMTRVSSMNDAVCQSTGQKNLDEDMCIAAGLAFGGYLRNGELTKWNWTETPQGCFLNPSEDNAIHFNNITDASQVNGGDGRYSILCAKPGNDALF